MNTHMTRKVTQHKKINRQTKTMNTHIRPEKLQNTRRYTDKPNHENTRPEKLQNTRRYTDKPNHEHTHDQKSYTIPVQ